MTFVRSGRHRQKNMLFFVLFHAFDQKPKFLQNPSTTFCPLLKCEEKNLKTDSRSVLLCSVFTSSVQTFHAWRLTLHPSHRSRSWFLHFTEDHYCWYNGSIPPSHLFRKPWRPVSCETEMKAPHYGVFLSSYLEILKSVPIKNEDTRKYWRAPTVVWNVNSSGNSTEISSNIKR